MIATNHLSHTSSGSFPLGSHQQDAIAPYDERLINQRLQLDSILFASKQSLDSLCKSLACNDSKDQELTLLKTSLLYQTLIKSGNFLSYECLTKEFKANLSVNREALAAILQKSLSSHHKYCHHMLLAAESFLAYAPQPKDLARKTIFQPAHQAALKKHGYISLKYFKRIKFIIKESALQCKNLCSFYDNVKKSGMLDEVLTPGQTEKFLQEMQSVLHTLQRNDDKISQIFYAYQQFAVETDREVAKEIKHLFHSPKAQAYLTGDKRAIFRKYILNSQKDHKNYQELHELIGRIDFPFILNDPSSLSKGVVISSHKELYQFCSFNSRFAKKVVSLCKGFRKQQEKNRKELSSLEEKVHLYQTGMKPI